MQATIRAKLELTGRPPGLVLNNGELADDTNPIAIQIAELRPARGKKLTDEQRERKDFLNWRGSLYLSGDGQLVLPARALFKAIVEAARAPEFKLGTMIEDRGAVTLGETELPVNHDGPDDLDKLWADSRYRFRTLVNPNPSSAKKGKLPLMRPVFPVWGTEATALILPEMINWDAFCKIAESAGNVGVGNARKIGYGRFDLRVTQL